VRRKGTLACGGGTVSKVLNKDGNKLTVDKQNRRDMGMFGF